MVEQDLFLRMIDCCNELVRLSNLDEFKDDTDFHMMLQETARRVIDKANIIAAERRKVQ